MSQACKNYGTSMICFDAYMLSGRARTSANLVYDQLVYDLTQPISLRPYAMDWLRYGRFKSWCKGAVQMFMEETGNEF